MESSDDKLWASRYLLDPLTAPEPSQETGPGAHHTFNTRRNNDVLVPTRRSSRSNRTENPPPPAYTNARHDKSSQSPRSPLASANNKSTQRQSTITPASTGDLSNSQRQSTETASTVIPTSTTGRSSRFSNFDGDKIPSQRLSSDQTSTPIPASTAGRRRTSSLHSRFEGDQSHRPLEIIKRDTKLANRAPHLRKKHHVGADTIDILDSVGGGYHHEGPFDATLLARNTVSTSSPIAAVRATNIETLKATPREMIRDSIETHRPLDGVASVPPGVPDRNGRVYQYEETNERWHHNRWPGVEYLPGDLKGKGEPSYSLEKALKESKPHRRVMSDGGATRLELITPRMRARSSVGESSPVGEGQSYAAWEADLRRSSTTGGHRAGGGMLRKRIGSFRRRDGE